MVQRVLQDEPRHLAGDIVYRWRAGPAVIATDCYERGEGTRQRNNTSAKLSAIHEVNGIPGLAVRRGFSAGMHWTAKTCRDSPRERFFGGGVKVLPTHAEFNLAVPDHPYCRYRQNDAFKSSTTVMVDIPAGPGGAELQR